eukprot:CAMPEP_0196794538 /NCGR_PEP_ID=MMETSP1104-20130614/34632_1 /TAXON_ID=33652 /ORGANISM="Cafeteria sp., Strain Caron Lab Isolate" /LENGTH=76 /DNA_ID=CAMNT_0042164919 /DNA_START=126 /DNA_END=356 /DNA_ORIENTATION=-
MKSAGEAKVACQTMEKCTQQRAAAPLPLPLPPTPLVHSSSSNSSLTGISSVSSTAGCVSRAMTSSIHAGTLSMVSR